MKNPLQDPRKQVFLNTVLLVGYACLLASGYFQFVIPIFWLHLMRLATWGGTFNGGSDSMTTQVGLGLSLSIYNPRLGVLWISIQLMASYFLAGFAKLKNARWRSGAVLAEFLPSCPENFRQPLAGAVISLELLMPFSLINLYSTLAMAVAFFTFHAFISIKMGLNRFFWAWLAAWPVLFFVNSAKEIF